MGSRLAFILAVAVACLAHPAGAQTYPDRPIRIVVPTGPGGATDIVTRVVAEKIQASLGQPVVVENRPGANGNVGAAYVLSQPADGYTLMMGHIGLMTINAHLYKEMKFNPLTEFAPVIRATTYANALVVTNSLPIHSTKDLVEYAKKSPTGLRFSSAGVGGSLHMGFELLKVEAGFEAQHVPYTATAKALLSVISGETDALFADVLAAIPHISSRSLRGVAISSKQRSRLLPDLPAVAESGIPALANFDVVGWNGLVAKTGTPADRIKLINEHVKRALEAPDMAERMSKLGADVAVMSTNEFGAFMRAEDKKWGGLVKKADLKVN
ncbi:MAG: Bug family tripartite tricarboxylate transporter substrate binding protein [Reyranella sp.]|uniref:Bug family tripartite tricarboxylate transporter substrate binding protein n=2 Tax=Reyranella sp. TaxID=1929291 RepID=UPI003D0F11C4